VLAGEIAFGCARIFVRAYFGPSRTHFAVTPGDFQERILHSVAPGFIQRTRRILEFSRSPRR